MTQYIKQIREIVMELAYEDSGKYKYVIYELDRVKDMLEEIKEFDDEINGEI